MTQVQKFYLASFLKNQIYFVPVIVLFFQDLGLNYSQIFWIFTIGAAFSFLIEIPTGVIADLYGNRRSIILSKFLIFVSFIAFAFSFNFLTLLIANLLYELGKSFRSGTETAYVYNYLAENKEAPSYTVVKANQKFYARLSESLGALLGGFLAYYLGFTWVFFIAALPAFINFIQTLSWEKLKEADQGAEKSWQNSYLFIVSAFKVLKENKIAQRIIVNISLFSASFVALDKFVQPYMKNVGLDLQYFGVVYAVFLIIIAFLVKKAVKLEERWGAARIMNYSGLLAFIPLLILASGLQSIWAVALFFFVLMIANFRSPVANTLFHEQVASNQRATMGSILALFTSLNQLWILPIIGYLADWRSMSFSILILAFLIFMNALFFWIKPLKIVN
jgi:MFS family permease